MKVQKNSIYLNYIFLNYHFWSI